MVIYHPILSSGAFQTYCLVYAVFKVHLVKIGVLGVMLMIPRQRLHSRDKRIWMTYMRFLNGPRFVILYTHNVGIVWCFVMIIYCWYYFTNSQANNCGPLQIISEYYRFRCPTRGSTLIFHPLEHLHPLEYHRLDENDLYLSGSTIDLKSCSTGLELAEVCWNEFWLD